MRDGYPDNNPKTAFGLAKTPLHLSPPALAEGAAEAFANGAAKYGPFNWREKQISSTVYYAAALRHLHAWYDRVDPDDNAPDSGVHHIKHAAACLGMILDTMGTDLLNDNRPPPRKPTCPEATIPSTSSSTRKPPSRSKSERSETKLDTTLSGLAKSTKETVSMSTTPAHWPKGGPIPLLTGGCDLDMPTDPKAT